MIRLPALTADGFDWHLPLTDQGAGDLLRCFLTDDAQQAESQFAELLSEEPPLTLWCLCRSSQWRLNSPDGFEGIACWLSRHGLSVLAWDDSDNAAQLPCDPTQRQRWAELAQQSVVASRLAASRAGDGKSSRLAVLGSLHNAAAWLASCGPARGSSAAAQYPGCLPQWLVEWLRGLTGQPPSDPNAVAVAQAITALPAARGEGTVSGAPGPSSDSSVAELVSRVRERWLSSHVGLSNILPSAIRKLLRLRELEERFDRSLEDEKLAALKAFAYGASHEINNPLANISTRAQTLLREETDPERRRKLAVVNSQAFRAHELIADLMLFARPPALSLAPVDLVGLVDQVVSELAPEAADQRTTLVRLPQTSPVIVQADRGHLSVALRSLCVNSLEAVRLGGRIEVSVLVAASAAEDPEVAAWAEIVVADTGPGISPEVRRHLFDPYFSGREAGRGIGLGLSKCWRIVTEHGGRIEVESQAGRGATFKIRLPAASASAGPSPRSGP